MGRVGREGRRGEGKGDEKGHSNPPQKSLATGLERPSNRIRIVGSTAKVKRRRIVVNLSQITNRD